VKLGNNTSDTLAVFCEASRGDAMKN